MNKLTNHLGNILTVINDRVDAILKIVSTKSQTFADLASRKTIGSGGFLFALLACFVAK